MITNVQESVLFNNPHYPTKSTSLDSIKTPLDTQVGGDHYSKMAIQPIEFAMANKLDACQSLILKYICRHESTNGAQDLDKAIHCIKLLKELKYGETT
jgi:hypothetical protein